MSGGGAVRLCLWLMIKSERETCQLGHLFKGAESLSWMRHFDWITPVMSAWVKVTVNVSLFYGLNQIFDEGLATVHNPWPSLSCLKSILATGTLLHFFFLLHLDCE